MTKQFVTTHDFVLANDTPLLMEFENFTKLADDGTTLVYRADRTAEIAMAVGMMSAKRRIITRIVPKGSVLTIRRMPHEYPGFPNACEVRLPALDPDKDNPNE